MLYHQARGTFENNGNAIIDCVRGVGFRLKLVDSEGQPIQADVKYLTLSPNPLGEALIRSLSNHSNWDVLNIAAQRTDGTYEGSALPGPGVVLVKVIGKVKYRPPLVDPKAFFELGRTEWPTGSQDMYGTRDSLNAIMFGNVAQADYDAIVLVNPNKDSEPLELSATVMRDTPRQASLIDTDGQPVFGVESEMLTPGRQTTWEDINSATFSITRLHPVRVKQMTFIQRDRQLIGLLQARADGDTPYTVLMQPASTITGRIVDADGKPIAEQPIGFQAVSGGISEQWGKSSEDGRFRLNLLIPGLSYVARRPIGLPDFVTRAGKPIPKLVLNPGEVRDAGDIRAPTSEKPEPAPEPPAQGSTSPAKPGQGAASGRVLRADTKQPIADVEVRLVKKPDDYWTYPLKPTRVRSNAAGEYRFEDLPPGEYRVYAFHDRQASRTQQVRFDNVTIDAEGKSTPVDLLMKDGLNMKVRVISKATGEPIPYAPVRLRWTDNDDNAQTDERGEALLSYLTPGEQYVEATAAGYSLVHRMQQLEAPLTEITLELPPGGSMEGRVTDEAGKPVAGVEVSATPNRGWTIFDEVTTDDQGRFTLQHLPLTDEFHVSASKKDWEGYFEPQSLQDGVMSSLMIRIRPRPSGGDVNVLIVDQAGKPIVGADAENHGNSSADVLSEKSDEAGRLTLRHLYVRSQNRPELVIRAAGFAPQLVSVPLAPPNTPAELRVTLEPGSRVRGRVLSTQGVPIPGAWIYFSEGNIGGGSGIGGKLVADSEGHFASDSLPPNCPFTIQGRGFTEKTNVKLSLNGPDEVTISLQPVGAYSGVVVNAESGTAVKTFNVKLAFATQVPAGAKASEGINADWIETGRTFTDTAGRFAWSDLPIDTAYDWIISSEGYESQRVVGQRSLAEPQEVRVKLKPSKSK